MLSGGRKACVIATRHQDLEHRIRGTPTVFGVIESELDGIHVGRDDHAPFGLVEPTELWRTVQGEMQLRDHAIAAQAPYAVGESNVEVLYADEIEEGPLGIGRRDNQIRLDALAIGQLHTGGGRTAVDARRTGGTSAAAIDQNAANRSVAAYLRTRRCCRPVQRFHQSCCTPGRKGVCALGPLCLAVQHCENRAVR